MLTLEHFVTLFDRLFLPQGLALHMSLARHVPKYMLWVLCCDDKTYEILGCLDLPNVRRLKLCDLETSELLKVKPGRTIAEYCWTLTPFAPRFVFEADPTVEKVTYLDADLWFLRDPKPIFEDFVASAKHVLITEHAYAPEYDQTETSGKYCVQFMIFSRHGGEHVRKWWEDRCVEWCFNRCEDGKFGDQKYLDDWPKRFADVVHVLQNRELSLAPWNAANFGYVNSVFYHFHGLRLISHCRVEIGDYYIPFRLMRSVYKAYFKDIREAIDQLQRLGVEVLPQAKSVGFARRHLRNFRRMKLKMLSPFIDSEQKI